MGLTPEKNETDYTYISFRTLTGKITSGNIISENVMFRVELFKDGVSQGKNMEYNRSFKRNYKPGYRYQRPLTTLVQTPI